jgi:hypothetical protein
MLPLWIELQLLMLMTYAAGFALGWATWGRKQ